MMQIPNSSDLSRFIDVDQLVDIYTRFMKLNEIDKITLINDMCTNLVLSISWIEICVIILLIEKELIQAYIDIYKISNMTATNVKLKLWTYAVKKMMYDVFPDIAIIHKWNDPIKWRMKSPEKFNDVLINILKNTSFASVKKEIMNMINRTITNKKIDINYHNRFRKHYDDVLKSDEFKFIEHVSNNIFKNQRFDINSVIFYTGWQTKIMDGQFAEFYDHTDMIIPIIADVNSNYKDIITNVLICINKKN